MSRGSKIQWTDNTWNVVTGCDEVSEGCDVCYAKTFAERWRGTVGHHFEQGFDVVLRPERLPLPLTIRKPRMWFVTSMGDLFHKNVPDEFIARTFAVMHYARWHVFQLFTKRPGRMASLLNSDVFHHQVTAAAEDMGAAGNLRQGDPPGPGNWPLPNVILGVSVENQHWANVRIPPLLQTLAAVHALSCEPLLGPVDLTRVAWTGGGGTHLDVVNGRHGVPGVWSAPAKRVGWVIAGGESGATRRPMHPAWARTLRDQTSQAGVAFFFKQWGQHAPVYDQPSPGDLWVSPDGLARPTAWTAGDGHTRIGEGEFKQAGTAVLMRRFRSKDAAGNLLDGRAWAEHPPMPAAADPIIVNADAAGVAAGTEVAI